MAQKQVPLTTIVRRIMAAHGRNQIFTNRYKTMRTVKCYAAVGIDHSAMINEINSALNGVPCVAIRILSPYNTMHRWLSFIVQLPL